MTGIYQVSNYTPCQIGLVKGERGEDGANGANGLNGKDGKDGKDGLRGLSGSDGKSLYQIALDNGFVGTFDDYQETLKGDDNYQLAVKAGFDGDYDAWVEFTTANIGDAAVNSILGGFVTIDSFELGATLTQRNQALRHAAGGKLYRWAGDLPKTVPVNSTPATSGGMGANAWLEVSDLTLRQELTNAGGAAKIGNAKVVFASVNAMSSASWVRVGDKVSTLSYHDGLGYGGGEYIAVESGTSLADGFEYINGLGLQFKLSIDGKCDITQAGARGVSDSTAIMAAAAVAKARKLPLIAPAIGKMYKLDTPVDLMGVHTIKFYEDISTSSITDAIAVTVGGMANSGVADITFQALYDGKGFTQPTPAQPVLRVFGAKGGVFEIGSCNYVQIYADAAVSIGNSTAYNRFELNGVIRRLELYGEEGYSWINENEFHRGRLIELYVISNTGYKHNHNLFSRNSFEGADVELKFINAWENRVEGARFEQAGSKGITFNEGSLNNIVETSWTGQASSRNMLTPTIKVTDNGVGNIVTSADYSKFKMKRVIAIDGEASLISDGASVSSLNQNVFPKTPNRDFLGGHLARLGIIGFQSGLANSRLMALSDLVPVSVGTILRLTIKSSVGGLRPSIELFDSKKKNITSSTLVEALGYTYNPTRNMLESSAAFLNGVTTAAIQSSSVAYVRLSFYTSTSASIYEHIYWDVFYKSDANPIGVSKKPSMTLLNKPTSGIPSEGDTVYVTSESSYYRANSVINEQLDVGLGIDNPTILLNASYTNFIDNGDVVGVLLDDGSTYWGVITDKSGSSFKIGALPTPASLGNKIIVVGWRKTLMTSTP